LPNYADQPQSREGGGITFRDLLKAFLRLQQGGLEKWSWSFFGLELFLLHLQPVHLHGTPMLRHHFFGL
jgi:hypothetical protein